MKTTPSLPDVKKNAHIGILGGSFDPPHMCHQLLALSFLALEPLDELWIIPCQSHAFKQDVVDFTHRYAMCEIAFKRIEKTRVLDLENKLTTPSYTIQTIEYILEKKPQVQLYFAIGSDLVDTFARFHRAEDLVKKTRIVVFERTSFPILLLPSILSNAHIHRGFVLPDSSSTSLRNFFKDGFKKGSGLLLDRDVKAYIDIHGLYN